MTILDSLAYYFTPAYPTRLEHSTHILNNILADKESSDLPEELTVEIKQLIPVIKSCEDRKTKSLYDAISRSEKIKKAVKKSKQFNEPSMQSQILSDMENVHLELKKLKGDVDQSRIKIEDAYNVCSDLGEVARVLVKENLKGLLNLKMKPGIPIRAMLAERLPSLSEIFEKLNGKCAFEYKYDGLRIQAHIGEHIQLFSRRLENITNQFPDVQSSLQKAFKGKNAIVEGECVPVDINTGELLPFQQVSHRRGRKYDISKAVKDFPVVLYLFDMLSIDSTDCAKESFLTRREMLKNAFTETDQIKLSDIIITDNEKEAQEFFEKSLAEGSEGVIAKSIQQDSIYRAGSRGWQWIKYKREYKAEMTDSVDLVVIGAFAGRGRRAGMYGALLMAAYNKNDDVFETVCKVGTGFSDEQLAKIPKMLENNKIDKIHPRVRTEMKPDFWFSPNIVMEIVGAEITHSPIHTCAFNVLKSNAGLAVRFPRFSGNWRTDKSAEDATKTDEIIDMYKKQLKKLDES
jgi:DNA ligase-1